MTEGRYQLILGTFTLITIFLALIVAVIIFWPGDDELNFDFPDSFSTHYIWPVDWPPKVQVIPDEFTCVEAAEPEVLPGQTTLRSVNGRNYCVTEVVEAAAGSAYTQYAYAFPHDDKTVVLTFSLRAVQCGNYPIEEMNLCEVERAEFNLDGLIASTVEEAIDD